MKFGLFIERRLFSCTHSSNLLRQWKLEFLFNTGDLLNQVLFGDEKYVLGFRAASEPGNVPGFLILEEPTWTRLIA